MLKFECFQCRKPSQTELGICLEALNDHYKACTVSVKSVYYVRAVDASMVDLNKNVSAAPLL